MEAVNNINFTDFISFYYILRVKVLKFGEVTCLAGKLYFINKHRPFFNSTCSWKQSHTCSPQQASCNLNPYVFAVGHLEIDNIIVPRPLKRAVTSLSSNAPKSGQSSSGFPTRFGNICLALKLQTEAYSKAQES